MQSLDQTILDKFEVRQFTVVKDVIPIPRAARAVHPMNNLNHVDPGNGAKQWIPVHDEANQFGTLVVSGTQYVKVEPGDELSVIFAKRGAFGRAQQTLVYIYNHTMDDAVTLPVESVVQEEDPRWVRRLSNALAALSVTPVIVHATQVSDSTLGFCLGVGVSTAGFFLLARFSAHTVFAAFTKTRRNALFKKNVLVYALRKYGLPEDREGQCRQVVEPTLDISQKNTAF